MAWLTEHQITEMGFASFGKNVMLSDKASYYNCKNIRLGSNVRIGDFCVLSAGVGGIDIGSYIHIAVYSSLIGAGNISLADFSGLSSRVAIYSSNDDYSGRALTNPTVPTEFTNLKHADVKIGRHAIIGSGLNYFARCDLRRRRRCGRIKLSKKRLSSLWYLYRFARKTYRRKKTGFT